MASIRGGLLQAPWDMYGPWKDMPRIKGGLSPHEDALADLTREYFHPADLMEMFENEQTERNRWLDLIGEREGRKRWEHRSIPGPLPPGEGTFTMPGEEEELKERHKDPVLKILDEIRESGIWDKFPGGPPRGMPGPGRYQPRPSMDNQYKFGGWE